MHCDRCGTAAYHLTERDRVDGEYTCPDCYPEAVPTEQIRAAAPRLLASLKWALEALENSDLANWPDGNGWSAEAYRLGLKEVRDAIAHATRRR